MPWLKSWYLEIKREGHNGKDKGKGDPRDGKRKAIKSMIEKECKPESTCSDVDTNTLNCTFESPERDERPDWDSLTDEEIAERKAARDERLQRILQCVCCTDATVEELLPGDKEGRPGKGNGKDKGKGDRRDGKRKAIKSMIEKECKPESTCSDVNTNSLDCTFKSPVRDERPDWDSLTNEEIAERKAARDERLQMILQCVC